MDYYGPANLEEALVFLGDDPEARCLAGGQTLVAMMNTGILTPSRLVSLRRLPELARIEHREDGSLEIGAMATHDALAGYVARGAHRLLPATASQIASPAIRAFGTIGGSVCHADPAADWPVALSALNASVVVAGPDGFRREAIEGFIVEALSTTLMQGEILTHIEIPPVDARSAGAYVKFARVEGDFATASVAVSLVMHDGVCAGIRIVVGGCAPTPVTASEAETALVGGTLDASAIDLAGKALAAAIQPEDDGRGSAEYRRLVVPGLVARAIGQARASVGGDA